MSSQTQHSASCRCHQADHGAAGQDLDEVEFQRSACNAALVGDVEKLEAILDRCVNLNSNSKSNSREEAPTCAH